MTDTYPTTIPDRTLQHGMLTDIGCRRTRNEDAIGFFTGGPRNAAFLLVVADGVGGNAGGDVASRLVVDALGEVFFSRLAGRSAAEALRESVLTANSRILEAAAAEPRLAGMASTCTVALVQGEDLQIAHVGDCRAYLARQGGLLPLTEDHSMAADYARSGRPLPPEKQGLQNVLTRWLGGAERVQVDVSEPITLEPEATLVMCSDGLTKVVDEPEILQVVQSQPPQGACQQLVQLARDRGGPDNISVQVARLLRT
jgi:serine/threonine protein phosphatase PrpC